ncbi:MAG: hypothetical protein WCJ30_12580 [Deltaproteobacteria bacterium]
METVVYPPQPKRFNTAGPCDPAWHYMIPPLPRVPDARGLVEQGAYFVLHAPRQSGKTTFLRAFAKQLTSEGQYTALYTSCEAAEAMSDDVLAAQRSSSNGSSHRRTSGSRPNCDRPCSPRRSRGPT